MSTLFKKIIDKEIPADILYENDHILCFKDVNSIAPKHYLIIPKKEIPTVNDIEESDKVIIGEMSLDQKNVEKIYPKKDFPWKGKVKPFSKAILNSANDWIADYIKKLEAKKFGLGKAILDTTTKQNIPQIKKTRKTDKNGLKQDEKRKKNRKKEGK